MCSSNSSNSTTPSVSFTIFNSKFEGCLPSPPLGEAALCSNQGVSWKGKCYCGDGECSEAIIKYFSSWTYHSQTDFTGSKCQYTTEMKMTDSGFYPIECMKLNTAARRVRGELSVIEPSSPY